MSFMDANDRVEPREGAEVSRPVFWEDTSDNELTRVSASDLVLLQEEFDRARTNQVKHSPDPFAYSAAYFGMTGRHGLWRYGSGDKFVLLARHPNNEKVLLAFPPYGVTRTVEECKLIKEALSDERFEGFDIEVSRVPVDKKIGYERAFSRFEPANDIDSTQLDWNHPVHIISAERVAKPGKPGGEQEKKLGDLSRNYNLSRRRYGLNAVPLSNDADLISDVETIVNKWAQDKIDKDSGHDGYEFKLDDYTSPTLSLLDLMKVEGNPLNIHGIVIYNPKAGEGDEGMPVGFWLWQEANGQAMSLARVSIGHVLEPPVRGSAEFCSVMMAKTLKARGIDPTCLGGSETCTLDNFKKKLGPVESVELTSLHYAAPHI